MTEERMVRISTELLSYPVTWRCYCDAPAFGTYNIAGTPEERERVARIALAHREIHKQKKVKA